MQIGQSSSPLNLRFDPPTSPTNVLSAEEQAKRTLSALSSQKLFEDNQRVLSGGIRAITSTKGREPLYREAEAQLAALNTKLSEARFANGGAFDSPGPLKVTSATRLTLGEGVRATSTGTTSTTTTTTTPPGNLDATKALQDQALATPITSGTISVSYQRDDAAAATTATIAIDKTRTLAATLADFSAATGGAVTAALSGNQIVFSSTSTSGDATTFDFGLADGTSNFASAIAGSGLSTSVTATATAQVDAKKNKSTYDGLTVTIDGVATSTGALNVTSTSSTDPIVRATELAGLINTALAGTGVVASQTNGTLSFTYTATTASAGAPPAISFDEGTTAAVVGKKGGKGKGGGGANQTLGLDGGSTIVGTLTATPDRGTGTTTTTTVTGQKTVDTTVGGPLGTSSTLRELAGQLGLRAGNGGYELEINGKTLTFSEDQTLDSVLTGINAAGAGVVASYDAGSQRVTIESTDGRGLAVADRSGNLAGRLGVTTDQAALNNDALGRELEDFASSVNETINFLTAGTSRTSGFEDDELLQDLQAALSGLFTGSSDGTLRTLGDLGFKLGGGEVTFDPARLADLADTRTAELNKALGAFVADRVQPLLAAGQRAIQDASALAPVESRAAAQAVRVRGEIARMQSRQQMLALERLNYEGMRERLEKQDEQLARTAQELERRLPSGRPEEIDEAVRLARRIGGDRPAIVPPPILAPGSSAPAPVALSSFGLSQGFSA